MTECVADSESYRNYWLLAFETGEDLELWNGQHYCNGFTCTKQQWLDALYSSLQGRTILTFNGNNYDMPLITLAMGGATSEELKANGDAIIVQGLKPWEIARVPDWIDHVDLFDVAPGQGSLKSYAARMHAKRLQDLPIEPSATINATMRAQLRDYCKNSDIPATRMLRNEMSAQIQLRIDMTAEYGIDLRSKSDAQIAEAVMKALLPFRVERPRVAYGAQFYYRPPEWLNRPELRDELALLARSPFTIGDNGSPVMTEELASTRIRIGNSAYQMGSGGLHSTESATMHVADAQCMISDHDVASYYPSLIIRTGIYPQQIGPIALEIYTGWYWRRLNAKARYQELEKLYGSVKKMPADVLEEYKRKKKEANSLKTLLNGFFGKLGSPWSIFYAPSEMIQVTITGQLALLLLIRRLETAGIAVISANTDGIVLKTPRHLTAVRDAIIAMWQLDTGLETEANEYRLLASRDVNSYIAIKPDGEVKTKGDYADPVPGASGWPNPKRQICVDAIASWLRDGVPVNQTIRACRDIKQFICMIKVTGGGSLCPQGTLPAKTTQKAMRALCGEELKGADLVAAYEFMRSCEQARREYLGKTVRWYYARGSEACIVTPKGGLVSRTEGCRPVMELDDAFPDDVDYEWYEREAADMLRDMGC